MGQAFKITREELVNFARKLYQEACYGYLDLCEPATDRMVADFLDGRVPVETGILSNLNSVMSGFGATVSAPAYSNAYGNPPPSLDVMIGPAAGGEPPPPGVMSGVDGVTFTETPIVREEVFVRDGDLFIGNPSERF